MFRACLKKVEEMLGKGKEITIAIPYGIGCGLGGGEWQSYQEEINQFHQRNENISVVMSELEEEKRKRVAKEERVEKERAYIVKQACEKSKIEMREIEAKEKMEKEVINPQTYTLIELFVGSAKVTNMAKKAGVKT